MEFAILGPIEARADGRPVALGGPKPRALLAMLLLEANRVVARERLIEGLWGEELPASATHSLDHYVSRLRQALGEGRLIRQSPGYLLRVEAGELDLDRFERLQQEAHDQRACGDAVAAAECLRAALALFRGKPLADVLYEPFAAVEAARLEELQLGATEERIDADLASGLTAELVPELQDLRRLHPLRERLLGQLMLALYGAGRHPEALSIVQTARRALATELGLELGPQLQELERRILRHDPSLARQPTPPPLRTRMSERTKLFRVVAGGIVLAGIAVACVVFLALRPAGSSSSTSEGKHRLVALTGKGGTVQLAGPPAALVAAEGSLWTADASDGTVSRIDPRTRAIIDRIEVGSGPGVLAAGGGAIWIASTVGGTISRIDAATDRITQTIRLGGASPAAMSFGQGSLWAADATDRALLEIDAATGSVKRTLTLDLAPTSVSVYSGAIWVADYDAGTVEQIDKRSGETLARIKVGQGPDAIMATSAGVWVANRLDGTVTRIDARRGAVVATIAVGSGASALAIDGRSVWVANSYSGTATRLDISSSSVAQTVEVGGQPGALALQAGTIWVGTGAGGEGHRGGTLVLLTTNAFPSYDPALYDGITPAQFTGLAYDTLVTFERAAGTPGLRLVPDLAVTLPEPADGGKTYAFRLRPGLRYSDGRRLQPIDFRRGFERLFRLRSPGAGHYASILGAPACTKAPARCDLRHGIVTDNNSGAVIFHLHTPDPDFLYELTSFAFSAPIPAGVPDDTSGKAVPGTGPYRIESLGNKEIRFTRNPFFREWSHAAQPDGNPDTILWRTAASRKEIVTAIEEGRADWTYDLIPPEELHRLRTRDPALLHETPWFLVEFAPLNSQKPPFNDVRVRRALNYAVDRAKVVEMYGGPTVAVATCQPLAPRLPGYRRYCPYTVRPSNEGLWQGPDLARGRALVAASGTSGQLVDVWGTTDELAIPKALPAYIAQVLRTLGYRTRLHLVPFASLTEAKRKSHQLSVDGDWLPDYPAPSAYLPEFFACSGSHGNNYYCNPKLDRLMTQAKQLQLDNPKRAATLWQRIDHELTDEGVWLPLVNASGVDLASPRIRNYQFHPVWGFIADQVWLK